MHSIDTWLQGPGYIDGERSIDHLIGLGAMHSYECLDVAVAYASTAGVDQFVNEVIGAMDDKDEVGKRWLVSIDFGQSHPDALAALLAVPKSELRVPDGQKLLNHNLVPEYCFHPKTYFFRQASPPPTVPASCLTGSANLTLGGLYGNTEHGVSASVWGNVRASDRRVLRLLKQVAGWWDFAWVKADVVDKTFIKQYRKLQKKKPVIQDIDAVSTKLITNAPVEIGLSAAAAWATANRFWIETLGLYKNNGPFLPGNQLDCRRGTRVFFGFPATTVVPNTVLGEVEITFQGKQPTQRSIRYGNNQMDKVNLPMPGGLTGPATYDHQCLLFTKTDSKKFKLSVVTATQQATLRKQSQALGLFYKLGGSNGREYGFC
jgi:hypothetical protein